MADVVVLGATGWVGRHVCEAFAKRGDRVTAVARTPAPGVVPTDLVNAGRKTLAELLRCDVVVNATDALNATDGWDRTEEELIEGNVRLVENVVAAIAPPTRLVHIGTIHEYGPIPEGTKVSESAHCAPANAYACSKLAGSRAALAAGATVLRAVNVCGPHPSPATFPGRLLSLLRTAASTGEMRVAIAGGRRDFVDVRDLAAAALRVADRPDVSGVINIGSGRAVALREFVELLVTQAGFPLSIISPEDTPVHSLGGDWIEADIRLAGTLLGWRPDIGLERSLRDMWTAGEPHLVQYSTLRNRASELPLVP